MGTFHAVNVGPPTPLRTLLRGLITAFSLIGFAVFTAPAEEGRAPKIISYPVSETGTDTPPWTPIQGPDGILHFGIDGLLSFDGVRWEISPMGSGDAARGLAFGSDGRIWTAANRNLGWFA